ncbi:unnamed protein product [Protopolystoma xenopodis]|uniref:Uncharacterized protein n=1 Tax=Protopolystoma xenopodis TaxID=117903 RepID=A0A448WV58_9PLAT|nr:unnamed protein product [Protopolystoma xenopodis]
MPHDTSVGVQKCWYSLQIVNCFCSASSFASSFLLPQRNASPKPSSCLVHGDLPIKVKEEDASEVCGVKVRDFVSDYSIRTDLVVTKTQTGRGVASSTLRIIFPATHNCTAIKNDDVDDDDDDDADTDGY